MSSLDHFKEIDELGYREQYFLAHSTIPPMFIDYRAPKFALNFLDMVRIKGKIAKPRYNSEELISSGGDNTESKQPPSPKEVSEYNDNTGVHLSI